MVHCFPRNGRMHYWPGSPRQRHNDSVDPSSEPESSGQALRHQLEDRGQVEEARLGRRSTNRAKRAEVHMLLIEQEAVVVAFRRHTLLALDDCLYALQATIPHRNGDRTPNVNSVATCVARNIWGCAETLSDRRKDPIRVRTGYK